MIALIIGGSGSGKSEFAENICAKFGNEKLYIATMKPYGNEAKDRILKHKNMRENKGFTSVDCYENISAIKISTRYNTILVECISNLLANEMYSENCDKLILKHKICDDILKLYETAENLIIVTNDINCDVNSYTDDTLFYIKMLGEINQILVQKADIVVEIVCGIPIFLKGSFNENNN